MEKRSYQSIKKTQFNFLNIVIMTVLLAAGVNMIASGIFLIGQNQNSIIVLIVGGVLTIGSLITATIIDFYKTRINTFFNGIIFYDERDKELVEIPHYSLSFKLKDYLDSARKENKDIDGTWKIDSLGFENVETMKLSESSKLLNKLFQYIIISELSIITTDYYDHAFCNEKNMVKYTSKDVPTFIAQNEFFNLFSKETRYRAAFNNNENPSNVFYTCGENGAIFERFELTLPKKCSITLENENYIVIKHPLFKMKIFLGLTGFNSSLPWMFEENYVKVEDDYFRFKSFDVSCNVKVNFSWKAFFIRKSYYYAWIDKFIRSLDQDVNFEKFSNSINWKSIAALIHVVKENKQIDKKNNEANNLNNDN